MAHDHDHHACNHDHDHKHEHKHEHGHGHGHHHHHGNPADHGRAFAISISLNIIFVCVEFAYGIIANSTALMADAGHNLSDVLGLALAWGAAILAKRAPSSRYTYGLRGSSILAALGNGLLLMLACGAIGWEAVLRFGHPQAVAGLTVSLVAGVGIVINGLSAWMLLAGSKGDLNMRGAYQHMAADADISAGVLVSGLAIMATGWTWLDPAVSIAIVIMILLGTWSLLREALTMAMAGVPDNVDPARIHAFLQTHAGVADSHDLHIWAMSTTETAMTVHLVMPQGHPGDQFLDQLVAGLKSDFAIHHCTVQVEMGTTAHACALEAPRD